MRLIGPPAAFIIGVLALTAMAACGDGGTSDKSVVVAATATPAPAPILAPTDSLRPPAAAPSTTAAPSPTVIPSSTVRAAIPTPTPTPVPAETLTATPGPTATVVPAPSTLTPTATLEPTPTPMPTPILHTVFDDFGFSLGVERGADVRATATATLQQGVISFAYGGVNAIMTWTPKEKANSLELVSGTWDLLQSNQPSLDFETLIDGEMAVGGEPGVFLGFKAVDAAGSASGGLIGSWTCPANGTSFTLTLTGHDSTLVQVRFDELIDNFGCSSL